MQDKSIFLRLVHTKNLYNLAQKIFKQDTPVNTSTGLIILDNSLENYIWTIVFSHSTKEKNDKNKKNEKGYQDTTSFPFKLEKACEICAVHKIVVDKNILLQMHISRNNIQHQGILTDRNQAMSYFSAVESFYKESSAIFQIEWEKISLSSLIRNHKIRSLYHQAEIYLNKGMFKKAANRFIISFEIAKGQKQNNLFGSGITFKRLEAWKDESHLDQISRATLEYVDSIHAEVECLKLSMDYSEWREYRLPLGHLDPNEIFEFRYFDEKIEEFTNEEWEKHLTSIEEFETYIKEYPLITSAEPEIDFEIPLLKFNDIELEIWLNKVTPFIINPILSWENSSGLFELSKLLPLTNK